MAIFSIWIGASKETGTVVCIAALSCPLVPSRMEDSMCWEIDYRFFAEQKKAQEARIKQERRAGVIDQLLGVCPSIRFDRFRREFDFAKSAI
jgi:hypothetical protein